MIPLYLQALMSFPTWPLSSSFSRGRAKDLVRMYLIGTLLYDWHHFRGDEDINLLLMIF